MFIAVASHLDKAPRPQKHMINRVQKTDLAVLHKVAPKERQNDVREIERETRVR